MIWVKELQFVPIERQVLSPECGIVSEIAIDLNGTPQKHCFNVLNCLETN